MTTIRELMGRITQGPWVAIHIDNTWGEDKGWGLIAGKPMRGRIDSQICGMQEDDAKAAALLPQLMALAAAVEEYDTAIKRGIASPSAYRAALSALQDKLEAK